MLFYRGCFPVAESEQSKANDFTAAFAESLSEPWTHLFLASLNVLPGGASLSSTHSQWACSKSLLESLWDMSTPVPSYFGKNCTAASEFRKVTGFWPSECQYSESHLWCVHSLGLWLAASAVWRPLQSKLPSPCSVQLPCSHLCPCRGDAPTCSILVVKTILRMTEATNMSSLVVLLSMRSHTVMFFTLFSWVATTEVLSTIHSWVADILALLQSILDLKIGEILGQ